VNHHHILSTNQFSGPELLAFFQQTKVLLEKSPQELSALTQNPDEKRPMAAPLAVAAAFYENSTRTRMSFIQAAQQAGLPVLDLNVATSSVQKGETVLDTIETLAALGAGTIVLRHSQDGLHSEIARYLDAEWPQVRLINAGEGITHHPTQALSDAYTLWNCQQGRNNEGPYGFTGKRILIVGDSRKSRVARSTTTVFKTLGATVSLCGPVEWLPNMEDPVFVGCQRHTVLNDALNGVDAIITLRVQTERGSGVTDAWIAAYQLTPERLQKTKKAPDAPPAWVLHPGPVNWGVELHPQFRMGQQYKGDLNPTQTVLIRQQVAHGVAVRQVLLHGAQ